MHRNARLTHWGRQELVRRIQAGTPIAHAAIEMNVSRPTATKWWNRFLEDPDGQWFSPPAGHGPASFTTILDRLRAVPLRA